MSLTGLRSGPPECFTEPETQSLNLNQFFFIILSFCLFQPDEDLFNPDYVEVDRVLEVAVTTDTETGEVRNPVLFALG